MAAVYIHIILISF